LVFIFRFFSFLKSVRVFSRRRQAAFAFGNSGVGIRSPLKGDPAYVGMEIQVLEESGAEAKYGKLRPEQFHGSVYDVFAAKHGAMKPVGQWNTEEIVANGRNIKVTLTPVICVARAITAPTLYRGRRTTGVPNRWERALARHSRSPPQGAGGRRRSGRGPCASFSGSNNDRPCCLWRRRRAGQHARPGNRYPRQRVDTSPQQPSEVTS